MERPSPRTCLLFAMSWWVRLVKWSLQVRVQRWHHDLTTVWKPESCCKVFVLVVLLGLVLIFGVVGADCDPACRRFEFAARGCFQSCSHVNLWRFVGSNATVAHSFGQRLVCSFCSYHRPP